MTPAIGATPTAARPDPSVDRRLAARARLLERLHRGLDHDSRGAVGNLMVQLELVRRDAEEAPPDSPLRRRAEMLVSAAERLRRAVELLSIQTAPALDEGAHDLRATLEAVAACLEPVGRERGVRIEWKAPAAPLSVSGSRADWRQALLHLALSAVEAGRRGDAVVLEAAHEPPLVVTIRLPRLPEASASADVEAARECLGAAGGMLSLDDGPAPCWRVATSAPTGER